MLPMEGTVPSLESGEYGGVDWCQQEEGWRSLIEAHCTRAQGSCVSLLSVFTVWGQSRIKFELFDSNLQI